MLQKEYWKTKPGESMDRRKFLKELRDIKKENFEQNLKFMDLYSKFLKSKTNKEWSRQQKEFINSIYAGLPKKG